MEDCSQDDYSRRRGPVNLASWSTLRKVHVGLVVLLGLSALPVAYWLPVSSSPLQVALPILFALNAVLLVQCRRLVPRVLLEGANVASALYCTLVIFWPTVRPTVVPAWLAVGLLQAALLGAGLLLLPSGASRLLYSVQQFALTSTLVFSVLLEPTRLYLAREGVASSSYLRTGLPFLFVAPLWLVVVASAAGTGWWRSWSPWVFLAIMQFGIGLFDAGVALDQRVLVYAGMTAGLASILVGLWAARRLRREARRDISERSAESRS
jgi:hypothetical protein